MTRRSKIKNRRAFSLLEVLIAVVIISLGMVSVLAASTAFTESNASGIELSTAEFLVEEVRELTTSLSVTDPNSDDDTFGPEYYESSVADYDDLDDFDGASFSPPIDIKRNALSNYAGYTQQVTVRNVSANDFSSVQYDHSTNFVRVTVNILLGGEQITSSSWIRANY
ncbi:Tfp pilus assembly protein PilV [Anaerohalosphaera lusitana]|uniref:Tfp pilus assembly protein PilV n=1 Tax=Anaerohalosphaera lusitana TaxID=1936003 RepID=A0A1U9NPC3_9BACT|nr:prepilin-type N-terminal cleavage/methylation domain-containing protein [Anaerohalosphaera lusitana]AQT69568.1 Tfp pilus assembly protein PilV [Anaerohalosphaera lusitana]